MHVSIEQGLAAHFFQRDGTSRPGTEWAVAVDDGATMPRVLVRAYADDTAGRTTADEAAAVIAFVESKLAAGWRPTAAAEPLTLPPIARPAPTVKPLAYWFPAKHYGWGWGLPATWQGWAVMIGYVVALTAVGILIAPRSMPLFLVAALLFTGILIAICFAKGEPPRWRWGDA